MIPEQLKKEVEELLRPLKHKVVEVGEPDVELTSMYVDKPQEIDKDKLRNKLVAFGKDMETNPQTGILRNDPLLNIEPKEVRKSGFIAQVSKHPPVPRNSQYLW